MKTKLLFTIIFLLTFFENTFSQEYHPFLNNSKWILNDWVSCCRPPYIRTIDEGTDAVIGEFTYKKFNDPFPYHDNNFNMIDTVFVREDQAAKKVYKIFNGVEVVLYDFSLEVGNTFQQQQYTFTVVAIDEFEVNGDVRKRLKLEANPPEYSQTFTQYWIEGVGSNAHPFYPQRNITSVLSSGGGYNIYTKCSFQNSEYIYGNSDYCSSILSTSSQTVQHDEIVISPNPFTVELKIDSTNYLQDAHFKLYNIQGQLVREENNLKGQKFTITRENLSSGSYFLQLFENNKLIKTGKILVD